MYAPGDSEDKMAAAIKDFNEFVIKDERVEVIALPFRDGVNIVQRRYCLVFSWSTHMVIWHHLLNQHLQHWPHCLQSMTWVLPTPAWTYCFFSPAPVLLQLGLTKFIHLVWTREVLATYVRVVASCRYSWHLMLSSCSSAPTLCRSAST